MPMIFLTPHKLQVVRHALSVAAQRFDEDAETMKELPQHARLVGVFEKQAKDTRDVLAELPE